ncbi:MAG: aldolase [Clostridia bacterium]|nr:aldolase [Clostridia bacterium]
MPLTVFYITNNPDVALIAESVGVDRIWVDLETLGKEERQRWLNSVKSCHTMSDVGKLASVLTKAELLVRINPWNAGSEREIEDAISRGAKRIMLPMWKTPEEVRAFLNCVNRRVRTSLLLETREAEECLDEVLKMDGVEEIHVGLNDLHLSYGLSFMFELLANGTVERIVNKIKAAGIPYGFGGISHLGDGLVPAEMIVTEHYRLGSTRAILSRSFCDQTKPLDRVREEFARNMKILRDYESKIDPSAYEPNRRALQARVDEIVTNGLNLKK